VKSAVIPQFVSERYVTSRVSLGTLIMVFGASCGGSSNSLDNACLTLARAECALRQACSDEIYPAGVNVIANYGDQETCINRQQQACLNNASAPQSGTNLGQILRCANEYPGWSCTDFFDNAANPPTDCSPAGTLSDGQTCTFNAQCASTFCGGIKNANCGTCAEKPQDGDSCATSPCAPGQECLTEASGAMVCRVRLPVGNDTCTSDAPCQVFASCVGSSATDPTQVGVCMSTNQTLGGPCGDSNPEPACEGSLGLACLGPTGSKTCQQVAYVTAGQCGTLPGGLRAECIDGDCFTPTGPAAVTDTNATCLAKVNDGAACDTQLGHLCQTPARCVVAAGTTQGICVFPNATACN
jgi:hypothetical protein